MLVLTRRSVGDEVIFTVPPSDVPTTIRMAVLNVDKMLFGFDAPANVKIRRGEIPNRQPVDDQPKPRVDRSEED